MTTLRMLCWSGYTEIINSYKTELSAQGLDIKVHEERNADTIYTRFLVSSHFYDIVIVDWEYRHRYESLVLPLKDSLVHLSDYLEPFRSRYLYELSNQLSFIPLRFGTNGLVRRLANQSAGVSTSIVELLSSKDNTEHIGVWDWWLPNLLLLVRAAGFSDPHAITERQLHSVARGILRDFSHRIASVDRRHRHLFLNLNDIIDHELSSRATPLCDWILGPSEMIVAPVSCTRSARSEANTLVWELPKEGGIVWLETAALSESLAHTNEKLNAAYKFLRFLQSPDIQLALICGQRKPITTSTPKSYWSYAMNNVNGINEVPQNIRASFHNEPLKKSAQAFGQWIARELDHKRLIMRALPENSERWQQAWKDASSAMAWT